MCIIMELQNVPSSFQGASFFDYECLYSRDIIRKKKRWRDGRVSFHTFNNRLMLYDEQGIYISDSHLRDRVSISEGHELGLEEGILIQVGAEIKRGVRDVAPLLRRIKPKINCQVMATFERCRRPKALSSMLDISQHANKGLPPIPDSTYQLTAPDGPKKSSELAFAHQNRVTMLPESSWPAFSSPTTQGIDEIVAHASMPSRKPTGSNASTKRPGIHSSSIKRNDAMVFQPKSQPSNLDANRLSSGDRKRPKLICRQSFALLETTSWNQDCQSQLSFQDLRQPNLPIKDVSRPPFLKGISVGSNLTKVGEEKQPLSINRRTSPEPKARNQRNINQNFAVHEESRYSKCFFEKSDPAEAKIETILLENRAQPSHRKAGDIYEVDAPVINDDIMTKEEKRVHLGKLASPANEQSAHSSIDMGMLPRVQQQEHKNKFTTKDSDYGNTSFSLQKHLINPFVASPFNAARSITVATFQDANTLTNVNDIGPWSREAFDLFG